MFIHLGGTNLQDYRKDATLFLSFRSLDESAS